MEYKREPLVPFKTKFIISLTLLAVSAGVIVKRKHDTERRKKEVEQFHEKER